MKKIFDNDSSLKIFSLVISVLCWIFIVFITNPEIEVTVSGIPITLSDHNSLKDKGYTLSTEIDSTIDIKLKGTRQMLANINKDNVLAYVDLSGCTNKGSYKLPVSIKLPYEEVKVVSKSIYNVTVGVDNYISRTYKLEYNHIGELKDKSYSINSTELSEKIVRISGPEDIIKTIENAVVNINLSRNSSDFSGTAKVQILNSNNTEITSDNIDVEPGEIHYDCTVNEKKTVKVIPTLKGDTSDLKYTITNYPEVTIIGPAEQIDKIASISTKEIYCDKNNLPKETDVSLIIPNGIKTEKNITRVKVLVESK